MTGLAATMLKEKTLRKIFFVLLCLTAVFILVLSWFGVGKKRGLAVSIRPFGRAAVQYEPTWESLDSRPIPTWYDEAKIGILIHWGVFSVPSYVSEWFWYRWKGPNPSASVRHFMLENYEPGWTYPDFAEEFTAEFFNPDKWAELFKASGARYVVQVTKHHEGFTTWPSSYSFSWNSKAVGPHRDLVGELSRAVRRKTSLHYGVYYSLFEWFNPLFLEDETSNFNTSHFVTSKAMPELYELVNKYKPDIVWSDGPCGASDTYWQSKQFLAWLYNDSPVKDKVVVNDRWGHGCSCQHGGFFTCSDGSTSETLQKHKWENAVPLDRSSWGFVRNSPLSDYLSIESLITTLIKTVSCGGNILINVGPTKEGTIALIYEERLRQMGGWLRVNGAAIYGTRPWRQQRDTVNPDVWYTTRTGSLNTVYALVLKWPTGQLHLGAPVPTRTTSVTLLGYAQPLAWTVSDVGGVVISIPQLSVREIPCLWAWVFQLTNIS